MTPTEIALAWPYLALAATLAVLVVGGWRAARDGLFRRPILVAAVSMGALPLVYVELVWTRLIHDRFLRVERPALAVVGALAVGFVVLRLLTLSPRMHRARKALTELFLSLGAVAASLHWQPSRSSSRPSGWGRASTPTTFRTSSTAAWCGAADPTVDGRAPA